MTLVRKYGQNVLKDRILGTIQSQYSFTDKTSCKIVSFRKIPKGKFYGGSIPISSHAISVSLQLNLLALGLKLKTDAFPTADGGILLNIYEESGLMGFEVKESGSIDFSLEKNGEFEDVENINFSQAKTIILKCSASGLSIETTGTQAQEDLHRLHSNPAIKTAEYLPSYGSVLKTPEFPFASTLINFMGKAIMSIAPPYSGSLTFKTSNKYTQMQS